MDANEKRMVIINSVFNLCSGMASVFLNVFLYTYTGNLASMALYTILRIGMFPIFFPIAGKVAFKKRYSATLTIGLVLFSLQLFYVLSLKDQLGVYPFLIYLSAMLFGTAEGFYYLSVNTLNQLVTSPDNVGIYLGYVGIGQSITSLISPLAASFLISRASTDIDGYVLIFKIVLGIYLLLACIASKITSTAKDIPFSLKHCFNMHTKPIWKVTLTTSFLYGIHNSMSLILSGLMLYDALGSSGTLYSKLLAVFSIISMISYALYNRKPAQGNIIKRYVPSAILMSTATIILVFFSNFYGGIYYGIVNASMSAPYNNGYNILSMMAVNEFNTEENITGRVIAREIVLSIGRIIGMSLILFLFMILGEEHYMPVAVTILSLFSIVVAVYTKITYEKLGLGDL